MNIFKRFWLHIKLNRLYDKHIHALYMATEIYESAIQSNNQAKAFKDIGMLGKAQEHLDKAQVFANRARELTVIGDELAHQIHTIHMRFLE